eukprot:TRINITY_DN34889_c0_g1_i1.p1 TRINITY_DN34889_c0_g1~~TRINITY_DN34889_c0_g1_i1.p1  ORF type:complete len:190 (-),score=56.89 TRINITY_DN34889_c0_g1_i1:69-638(-)
MMTGHHKDELEIFSCGPSYGIKKSKVVEPGAQAELSDILNIGRKLSNYGTYLCNRRHTSPSRHICSFLICPGRHSSDPYPVRPAVSLTPTDSKDQSSCLGSGRNRQARKKRGRVRFSDCFDTGESGKDTIDRLYPLDDDLTAKLSNIRLTKNSASAENNRVFEQSYKAGDMFKGLTEEVSRMEIQDNFQ